MMMSMMVKGKGVDGAAHAVHVPSRRENTDSVHLRGEKERDEELKACRRAETQRKRRGWIPVAAQEVMHLLPLVVVEHKVVMEAARPQVVGLNALGA
jgi:hypothetical protein